MLIIFYGVYCLRPKRLAYRGDYCLRCRSVRVAEMIETFNIIHVLFIPLIPLGRRTHWHCSVCGHDPHERVESSQAIKVLAVFAFLLFSVVAWLIPITRPEDVAFAWGFRTVMTLSFVAALIWARTTRPPDLRNELRALPPLSDEHCYFCRGPLDGRRFCPRCQVHKVDISTSS